MREWLWFFSPHLASTVDRDSGSIHCAGGVGGQEKDDFSDSLWRHPTTVIGTGHCFAILRRVDGARQNAVYIDALVPEFGSHALHQANNSTLGDALGG